MGNYKNYIEQRIREEAEFMIENNATIREVADEVHYSKSTVHVDLTKRAEEVLDMKTYNRVQEIIQHNKELRHFRGGAATKEKYAKLKEDMI